MGEKRTINVQLTINSCLESDLDGGTP